ncbi:MAG: hypothetical protein IJP86_10960 [Synergistaceae bacterium]|nr:hypothetical protein [Synergistaceae bacterium]
MKRYDAFAFGLNRTEPSIMGMIATMEGYRHGGEWFGEGYEGLRRSCADTVCCVPCAVRWLRNSLHCP